MNKIKLIFILLLLPLLLVSDAISYSDLVPVKNKNGMYQAEFKLDRGGAVKVNLPSDMALRENVSGSMFYNGNLSQFELLIENKLVPMSGSNFNFTMPSNVSTGVVNVLLRFSNGIDIGRAFFPINIVKLKDFRRESDENAFNLPVYGSSGIPVDVEGAFDGNYRNTLVTLSGKRMKILAESTTRTVFVTNNDHSGPGVLKLSELGKSAETKFTNLVVVKVEERVQEPEQILGYEQKGFEEQEFSEISEVTGQSSEEIKMEKEEVLAILAKSKQPSNIGDQDNTLLTENPANKTKLSSVKKTVTHPKLVAEEKEVTTKKNTIDTKAVVAKKEVPEKKTASQNKSLDYAVVKNDLEQQFSSKFYSNDPSETKKEEVAVATKPIVAKDSAIKADTAKAKEISNKKTNKKPVIAKTDTKLKTDKKEVAKVSQKTPEPKKVTALPMKKKEDARDFNEVKKDLNKQFSSKLTSPESEKVKPQTSKKTVSEKKIVEPKKTKKEAEKKIAKVEPKKSLKSNNVKKNTKDKAQKKEAQIAKKEEKKKPQVDTKKIEKESTKKTQAKKKSDEIAKKSSKTPSVTKYQPLVETKDSNVKEVKNKTQVKNKSEKKEDKLKPTQFIHTVVPEVPEKKKTVKGSEVKKESSKLVAKKEANKKDSDVKADKEKLSKTKTVKKDNINDTKPEKAKTKTEKKKQTEKKDKDIAKKAKSKPLDKGAIHTVVPEKANKKTEVAKAKKKISPTKAEAPVKTSKGSFCIQLASFKKQSEVDTFLSKMRSNGYKPDVKQVTLPKKGKWNRVRICDFDSRVAAKSFSKGINKSSLNISSVLVTEY